MHIWFYWLWYAKARMLAFVYSYQTFKTAMMCFISIDAASERVITNNELSTLVGVFAWLPNSHASKIQWMQFYPSKATVLHITLVCNLITISDDMASLKIAKCTWFEKVRWNWQIASFKCNKWGNVMGFCEWFNVLLQNCCQFVDKTCLISDLNLNPLPFKSFFIDESFLLKSNFEEIQLNEKSRRRSHNIFNL